MKVVVLSPGADTGGQGIALKRLFEGSDVQVRSVTASVNYIGYEPDLMWPRDRDEIQALCADADVWHVRNDPRAIRLGSSHSPERPVVLHEHGTQYRKDTDPLIGWATRNAAPLLVSTIDLLVPWAGANWLPAPIDADALAACRTDKRTDHFVIAHSPSVRAAKGTSEFLRAVAQVRDRHHAIEVDLIEKVSFEECQRRKGRADLFFDQLMYGYGNSGLEAMAMGIPVLSGAKDPRVIDKMRCVLGELPFHEAGQGDDLADRIEALVASADLREETAARGARYLKERHSPEAVREVVQQAWRRALV